MSVFCDSSALVKLYADEPGAAGVHALENVVVSALARVEVPAAILRKRRLGELAAGDAEVLLGAFESDWYAGAFAIVAVADRVLERAAAVAAAHPLRAYDAVQLASALLARDADPSLHVFACFDRNLAAAAEAEQFELLD